MYRNVFAALVLVATGFAGGWTVLDSHVGRSSSMPTKGIAENTKRGFSSVWRPVERGLVGVAEARNSELPLLNCQDPEGDVLRIGDMAISAESFCEDLETFAGETPDRPTEAWHRQARRYKEHLIETNLKNESRDATKIEELVRF